MQVTAGLLNPALQGLAGAPNISASPHSTQSLRMQMHEAIVRLESVISNLESLSARITQPPPKPVLQGASLGGIAGGPEPVAPVDLLIQRIHDRLSRVDQLLAECDRL